MAAKTRPSRSADEAATATEEAPVERKKPGPKPGTKRGPGRPKGSKNKTATTTAVKRGPGRPRGSAATAKLEVYYEDGEGNLTLMGSFKGDKPEDALLTYFNALESVEERLSAVDATTYAVNASRGGLVRLVSSHGINISRR